jgi:antibiotic biosynthesis monooxygenase (ABM) superfamily enzyme
MPNTKTLAEHKTTAFWKRWAISMLGVYPPLVVLVLATQSMLQDFPIIVSLFVIAVCLTGITAGLTLPFLHRRFHRWLNT